jgi:hypothetical protein
VSEVESILVQRDEWDDAIGWAAAFLAGFKSTQTRRSYRRDLDCWFTFCASHACTHTASCAEYTSRSTCANSKRSNRSRRTRHCTGASPH